MNLSELALYAAQHMDLVSKGIWYLLSALIAAISIYTIIKVHRDPSTPINLQDLFTVTDPATGKRVLDGAKSRTNSAFIICTWALIYLTLSGSLTEWFFTAYLAAWVYDRDQSRKQQVASSPATVVAAEEPTPPQSK